MRFEFECSLKTELHGICSSRARSDIVLVGLKRKEEVLMDTANNIETQTNEESDIEIFDITLLDFLDDLI